MFNRIGDVGKAASMSMLTVCESRYALQQQQNQRVNVVAHSVVSFTRTR